MRPWLACTTLVTILSCSPAGDTPVSTPADNTDADAAPQEPSLSVTFSITNQVDLFHAYLAHHQETYQITQSDESSFVMPKVADGTYDLVVQGSDNLGKSLGIRVNGIKVRENYPVTLENIDLLPTATISGSVKFSAGYALGARVWIEGTAMSADVNDAGNYILDQVPKGKHKLMVEADGYQTGFMELISVMAGDSILLDPFILSDAPQDTGIQAIFFEEKTGFLITPPPYTNLMRIGSDPEFTSNPWMPLASSLWLDLGNSGEKTIYVQFSAQETNLSSVFTSTFTVPAP